MKKRELLKRFYQTVGKYDRPYPYCHLSADATLGVFKIFKKEHYVPLGDYKLKVPLSKIPFLANIEIYKYRGIRGRRLRAALYILRRRKYFSLGVYKLYYLNKPDWAFVLSNGENKILVAPVVTDSRWNLLPLDKIVEKVDEKLKTFRLLVKL